MLPRALLTSSILLFTLYACHPDSEDSGVSLTGELPTQTLDLPALVALQPSEAPNWHNVGSVYADRHQAGHLEPTEGEGVLANLPEGQQQAHLVTSWEHEDVDLSLDFLLPKGARSGLFLQGRYAVRLDESWGNDGGDANDCGTIGQQPPRLNACRAPGLWQHLSVKFRAPRFNEQGQKTANARFTEVVLNGTVIQENVEVESTTSDAPFREEAPRGPLVISGKSALALKNVTYKTYQNEPIRLQDLRYQLYAGAYDGPAALKDAQPLKEGPVDSLSYQLKGDQEKFGLTVEGSLQVPTEGEYLLTLRTAGPSWLYVDGREVANNQRSEYMDQPAYYRASLEAGAHPFRLVYTKSVLKWVNGLSLYAEGPQIRRQPLHARSSEYHPAQPPPMLAQAEDQPILQRAFFYYQEEKKTHCVLVGLPSRLNYVVDLKGGTLLSAWSGDFIDVTQMWHERGEPQTAQPLGNPLELSSKPSFAVLSNATSPWPDSVSFDDPYLQSRGYTLDSAGAPVFHYQLGTTTVDDSFYPGPGARALVREVRGTFGDADANPVYCLLGEGERVEALPDGSYGIDGKRYYVSVDSGDASLRTRRSGGTEQLLAILTPEAGKSALQYTIIW